MAYLHAKWSLSRIYGRSPVPNLKHFLAREKKEKNGVDCSFWGHVEGLSDGDCFKIQDARPFASAGSNHVF
jgi:hypothetical protein